jgi:hypothetical protein
VTPLVVVADHATWRDGVFDATGVRAERDGIVVTAPSAHGDGEAVVLRDARVERPDGVFTAPELRIPWEGGAITALSARFSSVEGPFVEARSWTVVGTTWEGTDVVLRPCPCDGTDPYGLTARSLWLDADGRVRWRGAHVEVFETVSVPVPPGRRSLQPGPHLLLPEIGLGDDGLRVALPAELPFGDDATVRLRPEVRTQRGALAGVDARWGAHRGSAALAWEPGGPRGWVGGHAEGGSDGAWAAVDGALPSDPEFAADWGGDWLGRSAPWHELRAAAAAGPWTAHGDVFVDDVATSQRPVAVRWSPSPDLPAGLVLRAMAEGSAVAVGDRPTNLSQPEPVGVAVLDLRRPTRLGPIVLEPALSGLADASRDAVDAAATAALSVGLDAWRLSSGAYERLEPRWRAATTWDGTRLDRTGPAVRWSRSRGEDAWSAEGWFEEGTGPASAGGRVQRDARHWTTLIQGDSAREGEILGAVALRAVPVRPAASLSFAPALDLFQLGGRLEVGAATGLGAALFAAAEVDAPVWATRGLRLSWVHRSGCVSASAEGRLDADRTAPTVALRAELQPRRSP